MPYNQSSLEHFNLLLHPHPPGLHPRPVVDSTRKTPGSATVVVNLSICSTACLSSSLPADYSPCIMLSDWKPNKSQDGLCFPLKFPLTPSLSVCGSPTDQPVHWAEGKSRSLHDDQTICSLCPPRHPTCRPPPSVRPGTGDSAKPFVSPLVFC